MSDTHKSRKRSRWTSSKKESSQEKDESSEQSPVRKRDKKQKIKESVEISDIDKSSVSNEEAKVESNFHEFPEVHSNTIKGLNDRGIVTLFPIQSNTFRHIYDEKDIIARDLTGSGKTLAFCLPLVEKYRKLGYFDSSRSSSGKRKLHAIVLAPTRELALQVAKELKFLRHHESEYKVITVYGGVNIEDQIRELRSGVEFFVGTTGRVLDHIERGNIDFTSTKAVVLDEADQMLNMGFQEDVEKIMDTVTKAAEEKPQFCLFSATVPTWVRSVAQKYLSSRYEFVDLAKDLKNKTSQTVQHLAINCPYFNRTTTLVDILSCYGSTHGKTIVFAQTKADANNVVLAENMSHTVEVLHGDIAQNQREVTLKRFRENKFNVLVATDVASRGLDIPNVDLVIQLEPPKDVETYIHRSGRTARAGKSGTCITFYTKRQQSLISLIEGKAGIKLKKIGAPQPKDIIKNSVKDAIKGFDTVSDDVLNLFKETAEQLVDSKGAVKAVSLALAYISGTTQKLKKRSLLTGQEHFVTFDMQTNEEFRGISYVWGILRRIMAQSIVDSIKGMRMYNNKKGAVFDVPEEHSDSIVELYQNEMDSRRSMSYTLKIAEELPDLFEYEEPVGTNTRGGGYGRGRPNFGGRGGYDNNRYNGGGRFDRDRRNDYKRDSNGYKNSNYGHSNGDSHSGYGSRGYGSHDQRNGYNNYNSNSSHDRRGDTKSYKRARY